MLWTGEYRDQQKSFWLARAAIRKGFWFPLIQVFECLGSMEKVWWWRRSLRNLVGIAKFYIWKNLICADLIKIKPCGFLSKLLVLIAIEHIALTIIMFLLLLYVLYIMQRPLMWCLSKGLLVRKIYQVYFMKIQKQKAKTWLTASFPLTFAVRDCFSAAQQWALGHFQMVPIPQEGGREYLFWTWYIPWLTTMYP